MKVAVLMSGGVDSSVAAYLLKEQGHDVVGVHMIHLDGEDTSTVEKVAKRLGIDLKVYDVREQFRKKVIRYFVEEYRKGRTPNPCYFCNRWIKFGVLLDMMKDLNFDAISSGHYARVRDGKLYRALDEKKDQSYFLSSLPRDLLRRLILPLGDLEKERVREIARSLGMEPREESQDVCFLKGKDLKEFLKEQGLEAGRGKFVDRQGNVLGEHEGYFYFTIGQRRGLGVSLGRRVYVTKILPERNEVVLGDKEGAMSRFMEVSSLNFLEDLPGSFEAFVKIRSNFKAQKCFVRIEGDLARVEFDGEAFAVTPGQIAVFYKGEQVVLSGVIEKGYNTLESS